MTMMPAAFVPFPFIRGVWCTFSNFCAFEDALLAAGGPPSEFARQLRAKAWWWVKVRNEELYPAWDFSRHLGPSRCAEFRIGHPGADADIEIRAMQQPTRRLQITTAGPL